MILALAMGICPIANVKTMHLTLAMRTGDIDIVLVSYHTSRGRGTTFYRTANRTSITRTEHLTMRTWTEES